MPSRPPKKRTQSKPIHQMLGWEREVNQQMKNMQNEPNLQNVKINVTSFRIKDYKNIRPFSHRQNEPKTNPTCRVEAQAKTDLCNFIIFPVAKTHYPALYNEDSNLFMRCWWLKMTNIPFNNCKPDRTCKFMPKVLKTAVVACSSNAFYLLRPGPA